MDDFFICLRSSARRDIERSLKLRNEKLGVEVQRLREICATESARVAFRDPRAIMSSCQTLGRLIDADSCVLLVRDRFSSGLLRCDRASKPSYVPREELVDEAITTGRRVLNASGTHVWLPLVGWRHRSMQDAMVVECVRKGAPFKESELAVLAAFTSSDVTLEVSNPTFIRRSHDEWVRELVHEALRLRSDMDEKVRSLLTFWQDDKRDTSAGLPPPRLTGELPRAISEWTGHKRATLPAPRMADFAPSLRNRSGTADTGESPGTRRSGANGRRASVSDASAALVRTSAGHADGSDSDSSDGASSRRASAAASPTPASPSSNDASGRRTFLRRTNSRGSSHTLPAEAKPLDAAWLADVPTWAFDPSAREESDWPTIAWVFFDKLDLVLPFAIEKSCFFDFMHEIASKHNSHPSDDSATNSVHNRSTD
jgi:hypothetical protein